MRELVSTLRLELKAALTRKDLSGLVWMSSHAVQRFRERFEPEGSFEDARFSLTARVSRGKWHSARPWWVSLERGSGSDAPLENVGYIVGGEGDDEIVLPLGVTAGKAEPSECGDLSLSDAPGGRPRVSNNMRHALEATGVGRLAELTTLARSTERPRAWPPGAGGPESGADQARKQGAK
jgi:hypothetical protein